MLRSERHFNYTDAFDVKATTSTKLTPKMSANVCHARLSTSGSGTDRKKFKILSDLPEIMMIKRHNQVQELEPDNVIYHRRTSRSKVFTELTNQSNCSTTTATTTAMVHDKNSQCYLNNVDSLNKTSRLFLKNEPNFVDHSEFQLKSSCKDSEPLASTSSHSDFSSGGACFTSPSIFSTGHPAFACSSPKSSINKHDSKLKRLNRKNDKEENDDVACGRRFLERRRFVENEHWLLSPIENLPEIDIRRRPNNHHPTTTTTTTSTSTSPSPPKMAKLDIPPFATPANSYSRSQKSLPRMGVRRSSLSPSTVVGIKAPPPTPQLLHGVWPNLTPAKHGYNDDDDVIESSNDTHQRRLNKATNGTLLDGTPRRRGRLKRNQCSPKYRWTFKVQNNTGATQNPSNHDNDDDDDNDNDNLSSQRYKGPVNSENFQTISPGCSRQVVPILETPRRRHKKSHHRHYGNNPDNNRPSTPGAKMKHLVAGLKMFGIKGELYIRLLVGRQILTITVDKANNLTPPDGSSCCNSYVRITLIPDDGRRPHFKTKLVAKSNKPVFNETFSIQLLPEDFEKRLLISVWHRPAVYDKSIFVGCMSFTIQHLASCKKQVEGWYFLMSPQFGKRKHLAVHKVTMLTYYGAVDSPKMEHSPMNRSCRPKRYIL